MNEEEFNQLAGTQQLAESSSRTNAQNSQVMQYEQERLQGINEQIEVESILIDIYHMLKQDRMVLKNGTFDWEEIPMKQRTFSEWGVEELMKILKFYVNKNTLLSNYDEKQIPRLMLTFLDEVNDLFLLKYEHLFVETSFEECKEIILNRIKEKKKLKMFALEIIGKKGDEKEIEKNLLLEIEKNLEWEIQKVKQEKRKERIREYGIVMAVLEQIVYATFNRAYRGEERGSARRHTNIQEVIGRMPQPQQSKSLFPWVKS